MGFQWNEAQTKVIDSRNETILVAAAAGSGKTAVLVERIIRMLCENPKTSSNEGLDIDRFVIVTFTVAAAAEMREKIRTALEKKIEETAADSDPTIHHHLLRQNTLIHNAMITTIDSFCGFVVRNHFADIGLEPDYRLMDTAEEALLRQEVLDAVLEKWYGKADSLFIEFVEALCTNVDERAMKSLLLSVYDKAESTPFPKLWLKNSIPKSVPTLEELEKESWYCNHMQMAASLLQDARRLFSEALRAANQIYEGDIALLQAACSNAEACEKLFPSYEKTYQFLADWKLTSLSTRSKGYDAEALKAARQYYNLGKDIVEKLRKDYLPLAPEAVVRSFDIAVRLATMITDIVADYADALLEEKKERKTFGFGDIAHFALEILMDADEEGRPIYKPAVEEFRRHFSQIIIDEYQDSNLIQEYLLSAISMESEYEKGNEKVRPNRFLVGDVKQSIYGFRNACPELFREKFDLFKQGKDGYSLVELSQNFRSRREVLDSVNDVFSLIMHSELGGVEYDANAALNPSDANAKLDKDEEHKTELCLLTYPDYKGKVPTSFSKRAEAIWIAKRIKQMVESEKPFFVTQGDVKRPCTYGDITILARTVKDWDVVLKDAFEKVGVPLVVSTKVGFYHSEEIVTLLNYVRIINNPYQDIPLFGSMKSCIGGFTDEEMAMLSVGEAERLYDRIKAFSGDAVLRQKCDRFIERLEYYQSLSAFTPIYDLLHEILREYHYRELLAATVGGVQKCANLDALMQKALDYQSTSFKGLNRFINYVDLLIAKEQEEGDANTTDGANAVHLATVHSSKGLEYPICFLTNINSLYHKNNKELVFVDHELGVASKTIDVEQRVIRSNLYYTATTKKMDIDSIAEEMRLLYVAMTRAKEKLILVGSMGKTDRSNFEADSMDWIGTKTEGYLLSSYYQTFLHTCRYNSKNFKIDLIEYQEDHYEEEKIEHGPLLREGFLQTPCEDEARLTALRSRIETKYPHPELTNLIAKTSVSELKMDHIHREQLAGESGEPVYADDPEEQGIGDAAAYRSEQPIFQTDIPDNVPSFAKAEEKSILGVVRGTAYHRVFELLRLGEATSVENIQKQMEEMVAKGEIAADYAALVDPSKILIFAQSDLAKRMDAALKRGELYREQPFVIGMPARRVNPEMDSDEMVLIQGIVDAFFVENGHVVLVDYKTDRVDTEEALVERYRVQFDQYTEALTRLMQLPVEERYIYSVRFGKTIAV